MKRIIVTSSILALTGTAALAGGYTAPQTEAVVTPAPVVVAPANYNWSGFYGGAQLGYGKAQDAIEAAVSTAATSRISAISSSVASWPITPRT